MRSRQKGNFLIGLIVGGVLGLGLALGVAVYVTKVPVPFVSKPQTRGADQDEAEARKNRDWDPNSPLAGRSRAPAAPAPAPAAAAPTPSEVPVVPPAGNGPVAGGAVSVPAPVTVPTPAAPAPRPTAAAPTQAPAPITVNPIRPGTPASSDPLGDFARARTGGSSGTAVAAASPAATPSEDAFIYFVQAGAFRTQDDADAQRARLSLMGVQANVTEREQAGRTVYRVRVGPFGKKDDADRAKGRLEGNGFESALVRVQR